MDHQSISSVLVTGGAGFIGSHIVDELIKAGYHVGVLDNFSTGEMKNLQSSAVSKLEIHEGDISDCDKVAGIVNNYDAIIHEAALVSVTRSVEDPIVVNRVNISGTLNLLKAAVDSKVKRFIYASSSSVYGETESLPKKETMPTIPISPYGNTKLSAENYCRVFAKVYGLSTVCLRYFNVYGPRQKFGPYSGVIPIFIGSALKGKELVIYGDGEQTRDFTFVRDVVQANLLSLRAGSTSSGEVFNIATGNKITIKGLAEIIIELANKPGSSIKYEAPRKGDIKASYADISKARRLLGYNPSYSIRDGLRQVLEWFITEGK